jgi:DNA-binding CsgD family transcriptional regulator/PAS domain-containing protein
MPHHSLQLDNCGLPLLDAIYAAGADSSLWPQALIKLADALGAQDAALGTVGPLGLPWLYAPRTDPSYMAIYPERYFTQDLVWQRTVARGVGAAVTDQMVTTEAEQSRCTTHNEWYLPQGYRSRLGGMIVDHQGWQTVLMMPGKRVFDDTAQLLFAALSGHIARAVQFNIRLAQADQHLAASEQVLQSMPRAAFVLDAEARLLLANPAGEALLGAGGGLYLRDGHLSAHDPRAQQRLCALVRESLGWQLQANARSLPKQGGCAEGELLLPQAKQPARRLLVTPLPRARARASASPLLMPGLAAVLIIEAETIEPSLSEHLQQRFGLTPAEARLALEIAQGDGKNAAAERLGITFSTARTHLSRVFDKTGVRRQAELVRLVASLGRGETL